MRIISKACEDILDKYRGGQTEAFYEKMLGSHLYNQHIPFMTQVDCFTTFETTQVLVGRLDMEIAHTILLELKAANKIMPGDETQLRKYVQCKRESGMEIEHACIVCFRNDHSLEVLRLTNL